MAHLGGCLQHAIFGVSCDSSAFVTLPVWFTSFSVKESQWKNTVVIQFQFRKEFSLCHTTALCGLLWGSASTVHYLQRMFHRKAFLSGVLDDTMSRLRQDSAELVVAKSSSCIWFCHHLTIFILSSFTISRIISSGFAIWSELFLCHVQFLPRILDAGNH